MRPLLQHTVAHGARFLLLLLLLFRTPLLSPQTSANWPGIRGGGKEWTLFFFLPFLGLNVCLLPDDEAFSFSASMSVSLSRSP
jgi:hypothetical protein